MLMVADWAGFIIDLGFFSSSRCCGGVGGYCGDLKRWVLVAAIMMAFFSLSIFLIWNLDLVLLVVVCAYIQCWSMLASSGGWWWLICTWIFKSLGQSKHLKMFY